MEYGGDGENGNKINILDGMVVMALANRGVGGSGGIAIA